MSSGQDKVPGTFRKWFTHSLDVDNLGKEMCPFWAIDIDSSRANGKCNLIDCVCQLGVTEITPPQECPLRKGNIVIGWEMD